MFTHLLLPRRRSCLGVIPYVLKKCASRMNYFVLGTSQLSRTRTCACTEGSTVINYYAYLEVEDGLPPSYLGTTCKIAYLVAL